MVKNGRLNSFVIDIWFILSKVEVEQALVEAEMESEVAGLQQEKDALEALHTKMSDLETKSQQEKEKVFANSYFHMEPLHWVQNPYLILCDV